MYLKLEKGMSYTYKNTRIGYGETVNVEEEEGKHLLETGRFKQEEQSDAVEKEKTEKKKTTYVKKKTWKEPNIKTEAKKTGNDEQETVPAYE